MANANTHNEQRRALGLSTLAFTVCFAVWTLFSILGLQIRQEFALSDTQLGLLMATPVLTGSISRLFLGILTDRFGGRWVFSLLMLVTAGCVYLLTFANSYPMLLLAALGIGLAGGSFIVGVAYTSAWFERERQGTALGIFGAGNIGAAVTNFGAPFLLLALDWRGAALVYATGLSGATLRIFYSFMVPIVGGRRFTALSTASLALPALWIGFAVQNPETPYLVMLILALLCGFGGGNFASSMANISFFYPKREKGNALALNAGLGNLGVSVMQFLIPLAITAGVFGALGGEPQALNDGERMWLQNAGFVWVPFILLGAVAAWFGMNDIASARSSFKDQAVIFKRKHNWLMCVLYTGTFGSFIGYSAGFPLLASNQFPEVDVLQFAFLGPLVGALSRAGTGWISDRFGGARVTLWVFAAMIACVAGVLFFLGIKDQPGAFWGFFAMFLLLFFFTGVGNASTFQMIPEIFRQEVARLMPSLDADAQRQQSEKESAATIGFTSAIAAYGAFFIPKTFGSSIALTGGAELALYGFIVFYAICVGLTWFYYTRANAEIRFQADRLVMNPSR